jgi:predicted RNA-binding protein (virulence factor B family)
MIQIGQTAILAIIELSPYGAFLEGENLGKILLPNRYTTPEMIPGKEIEVFIYLDSEDRLVATTEMPLARVGDFAYLKTTAVTNVGAFLNWGLSKDLLVPFREQKQKLEEGQSSMVYVYLDDATKRIVASAKIDKFLDNVSPKYQPGEEVNLIIADKTELGYKAIINQAHSGLLYQNETNVQLQTGQKTTGYIKRIREDEKIDLSLAPLGQAAILDISEKLITKLEQNNNFLPLTDQSTPEEIRQNMGVSKKAFKKAAGALYKQKIITLEKSGIRKIK